MKVFCKYCIHYGICDYSPFSDKKIECKDFKCKADYMEVVRCKDCKYWKQHFEQNMGQCYCNQWENDYFYCLTKDIDFCSYGERKDKEV